MKIPDNEIHEVRPEQPISNNAELHAIRASQITPSRANSEYPGKMVSKNDKRQLSPQNVQKPYTFAFPNIGFERNGERHVYHADVRMPVRYTTSNDVLLPPNYPQNQNDHELFAPFNRHNTIPKHAQKRSTDETMNKVNKRRHMVTPQATRNRLEIIPGSRYSEMVYVRRPSFHTPKIHEPHQLL